MTAHHEEQARAAATRVARESYGKLIAFLAAPGRDVPGAEDALADAFASALAVWPARGVPANPEGWLAKTARRRLIDAARRRRSADKASDTLALIGAELKEAADAASSIPDRRLALMFACAHPAIEESIRAPLMLQTILGLDAAAIASAFLVSPAAMGQRLDARQGENSPGRRAVQDPRARGSARASRGGAGGDLRRLFARLGGSVLRRSARAQSRRGGDLARPRPGRARAERAGSDGPHGADALRACAARGAPRRARALCSAERAGRRVLGPGGDRRSRRPPAGRERAQRAGTLSARGGRPVRPRRPPADAKDGLGGDRCALRRAVRLDRLAGRRGQSRGGGRAHARGRWLD